MKFNLLLCALLQQASCAVLSTKHDSFTTGKLARRAAPPSCLVHMPPLPPDTTELKTRGIDSESCSEYQVAMKQAYTECAQRARSGAEAAKNGSSTQLFKTVFHTTDQGAVDRVAKHLTQIADECAQNGNGDTPVRCFGPPSASLPTPGSPHSYPTLKTD